MGKAGFCLAVIGGGTTLGGLLATGEGAPFWFSLVVLCIGLPLLGIGLLLLRRATRVVEVE